MSWNGKIKSLVDFNDNQLKLTKDKIYDVVNGRFHYDGGWESMKYKSFEDFMNSNRSWKDKFVECKEDKGENTMKLNINKAIGKIVHCETEEQAKELLSALDKIGWQWASRNSLLDKTNFERYGIYTCYNLMDKLQGVYFGDTGCYDNHVDFIDLLESETQQETPTKMFQYYIAFETKKGKGACFTDSNLGVVDTKFLLGLIEELGEQLGDTPIITNLIPLGEKKQVI